VESKNGVQCILQLRKLLRDVEWEGQPEEEVNYDDLAPKVRAFRQNLDLGTYFVCGKIQKIQENVNVTDSFAELLNIANLVREMKQVLQDSESVSVQEASSSTTKNISPHRPTISNESIQNLQADISSLKQKQKEAAAKDDFESAVQYKRKVEDLQKKLEQLNGNMRSLDDRVDEKRKEQVEAAKKWIIEEKKKGEEERQRLQVQMDEFNYTIAKEEIEVNNLSDEGLQQEERNQKDIEIERDMAEESKRKQVELEQRRLEERRQEEEKRRQEERHQEEEKKKTS